MNYESFYKTITGFESYDYQRKVAELLLSGKNVILSVPTGAGKTWASIMPFLYSMQNKMKSFPQKLIYSLPLRTLTNSIYLDTLSILEQKDIDINLSVQTGEFKEDVYFENDIVFSTIDQTLSNFLCFPLALSKRQANINAGALIGSYLVFDEFHLLDPKLSMSTTLGMLRILNNLCRVCIMTATLTSDYIEFIKKKFGFEVVTIEDFPDDKLRISSLKPPKYKNIKKHITVSADKTLSADIILEKHQNKSIVICNRVETAQKILFELQERKNKDTKILSIHARFFDSDRKIKETEIKKYFGKNSGYADVILVATQVIEAGMDISCEVMHTEISPVNSFLQRIGRCARFENEYGEVYVYDIISLDEKDKIKLASNEEDKNEIGKINNKYLPYDKEACEKSLIELAKYSFIDESIAEKLVNDVLKEKEVKIIDHIGERQFNIEKIKNSWQNCDKNNYRETIRDIQSIEIVLVDLENRQDQKVIPWKYETISVYKWSFISWIKKLENEKLDCDDWIIAKAEQSYESCFDFEWQEKDAWFLRKLNGDDVKNHYDIVFVNNRYFNYSKQIGLIVENNDGNIESPLKQKDDKEKLNIVYKKDTFYEHNKALLNCFEKEFKPKLQFVFTELDKYYGEKTDWESLIKIVIWLHDYGKLNEAWQKPMKEFQRRKTGIDDPYEILAHTDYDDSTDKELAKECKINSKPGHAGIGAVKAYYMFYENSEELANILSNVIMKHHNPDTQSFDDFSISKYGKEEARRLLTECGVECARLIQHEKGCSLNRMVLSIDNNKKYIIYLFMVRILRLCDQKATESLENYIYAKF